MILNDVLLDKVTAEVEVIEPSAILEVKDGPYMPIAPEDMMD